MIDDTHQMKSLTNLSEEGLWLDRVADDQEVVVKTRHSYYIFQRKGIKWLGRGGVLGSEPKEVTINGSVFGGVPICNNRVIKGFYLEFWAEGHLYTTSQIEEILVR